MSAVRVLLVEDNPADVVLTKQSFKRSKFAVELDVVTDGEEAIYYLRQEGKFSEKPLPQLILLDLNLPRKDGREVLEEIKESNKLREIPVVVLTSSDAERDIAHSYRTGANCYVRKPVDFETFQDIILKLEEFWFTIVKLPINEA